MRKRLGENCLRCVGYGHVGDSNLHLVRFFYNFLGVKKFPLFVIFVQNITTKEYSKITDELIEPYIFEWVSAKRGSISAEHGIGFKKTKYLHFSKSDELIHQMRLMKTAMDPNGILNPYKVLPLWATVFTKYYLF